MTDESSQLYENPSEFLYENANETDVGSQGPQGKENPNDGQTGDDLRGEINRLKEQIKSIKRKFDEQTKTQSSETKATTRGRSPEAAGSESFQVNEVTKELIKLIPRYDGAGGIQKFFEFVDSFDDFATNAELTSQTELTVATAKLTGDAKLWWREHKRKPR